MLSFYPFALRKTICHIRDWPVKKPVSGGAEEDLSPYSLSPTAQELKSTNNHSRELGRDPTSAKSSGDFLVELVA